MSESSGDRIICRQCGENISASVDNCPHCGTSVRGKYPLLGGIVFGIAVILFSLFGILFRGESGLWFFVLVGAAVSVVSFVFYRDRRDRVQEADEEHEAE